MAGLPGVLGEPIRFVLNWGRRYSLWVFNFGLACCAIEFIATSMGRHDFIRLGVIPMAHGPRQADLMVVSGTVTDKMAPAIKRLYEKIAGEQAGLGGVPRPDPLALSGSPRRDPAALTAPVVRPPVAPARP